MFHCFCWSEIVHRCYLLLRDGVFNINTSAPMAVYGLAFFNSFITPYDVKHYIQTHVLTFDVFPLSNEYVVRKGVLVHLVSGWTNTGEIFHEEWSYPMKTGDCCMSIQWENISSRFPSNSEALASELLGNLEEMFMHFAWWHF